MHFIWYRWSIFVSKHLCNCFILRKLPLFDWKIVSTASAGEISSNYSRLSIYTNSIISQIIFMPAVAWSVGAMGNTGWGYFFPPCHQREAKSNQHSLFSLECTKDAMIDKTKVTIVWVGDACWIRQVLMHTRNKFTDHNLVTFRALWTSQIAVFVPLYIGRGADILSPDRPEIHCGHPLKLQIKPKCGYFKWSLFSMFS